MMENPLPGEAYNAVGEVSGTVRCHPDVSSAFLRRERDVLVWLPPSYSLEPEVRYPVLYMQDGQQVFDPGTSTWEKAWDVDKHATALPAEVIIVAACSTEDREREYDAALEGPAYGRFLLRELKPMIDRAYRTLPDRDHTAIAGSSMGGAIAFYLAWTFPHLIGAAACLSPAFEREGRRLILDQVRSSDITPDIRLFLSCGGGDELEQTLLGQFNEMRALLERKRMKEGRRLAYHVDESAPHNEAAWAAVTPQWLRFLYAVDRGA